MLQHPRAVLGCACIVLGLVSCTNTVVTRTEIPTGRSSALVPKDPHAPRIVGSDWAVSSRKVEGRVRWAEGCELRVEEKYKVHIKATTTPDVPLNLLWTAAGLAAGGTGAYVWQQNAERDNLQRTGGIGLALMGGLTAAAAIATLASPPRNVERFGDASDCPLGSCTRISSAPTPVACGSSQALARVRFRLAIPEHPVFAQPDKTGHLTFVLPEGLGIEAKGYPITVEFVPDELRGLLVSNRPVGEVDLAKYVAAEADQAAALRRDADQHLFEGVVHGDAMARAGFTVSCTSTGKDECFDAIDNDCDGLYDLGCGYQSGALQWTLAWRTGDDLDLHVIGPDGVHVYFANRRGKEAGLTMDVDCLGKFGNNCPRQNVENIFTPNDKKPLEGTYRGWVQVHRAAEDDGEAGRLVEAMLGGRIAGKAFRMPLKLQGQSGVRVFFAFAVGKDTDRDSIVDVQDACPAESGVYSSIAEQNGCPDDDLDGIANKFDACPGEEGLQSSVQAKHGCPLAYGHARLTNRGVQIDAAIQFATGSAVIQPQSFGLLRDVARVMKEREASLRVVDIEGHTDSQGEREMNMRLSRDRAKSVREHLLRKEKISPNRLLSHFFGPDRPRAANDSEDGRKLNRRVEFRVLDPEPTAVSSW